MPFTSLYESIFPRTGSAEADYALLEEIAAKHPYFSLAHFFLMKKMPGTSPAVTAKTALHFNNPFLLNLQLKKELKAVEKEKIETTEEEITPVQQTISEPMIIDVETLAEAKPEETQAIAPQETTENIQPDISPDGTEVETANEETTAVLTPVALPVKDEKTELLFEPLHTTDYFASQGIKLSEEVQPTDKLGKQLRSFTEWLKTMKKVHESKLPEGSEQLDASVNKLAEKSNKDEEILTEAMAEAYIIQGKPEKAKDVYLKLSLLNPSKNAYFAAKIDGIAW